jgi:hypothetical protein
MKVEYVVKEEAFTRKDLVTWIKGQIKLEESRLTMQGISARNKTYVEGRKDAFEKMLRTFEPEEIKNV